MKKNEFVQIKGLDVKELQLKAKVLSEEIANLSLDKNMKKLKDVKMVSKKKKELAQVLTVIGQKKLLMQLESQVQKEDSNKTVIASEATVHETERGEAKQSPTPSGKIATSPAKRRGPRNDKRKRSKKL